MPFFRQNELCHFLTLVRSLSCRIFVFKFSLNFKKTKGLINRHFPESSPRAFQETHHTPILQALANFSHLKQQCSNHSDALVESVLRVVAAYHITIYQRGTLAKRREFAQVL